MPAEAHQGKSALADYASAVQRVGWHHVLLRKQMCQAYAAKRLVFLFRLRWIIQDCWLLIGVL